MYFTEPLPHALSLIITWFHLIINNILAEPPSFLAKNANEVEQIRLNLNITRDRYLGAIEVCDLPSLEDAKLFAEGSLKELDYGGDSALPVTIHCTEEDTQMTYAANIVPWYSISPLISDHRLSDFRTCGRIDVYKSRFGQIRFIIRTSAIVMKNGAYTEPIGISPEPMQILLLFR